MAGIRLRLGEADQKTYDRGDEWFTYDIDALLDLPASKLVELEDTMGGLTVHQVRVGLYDNTAMSLRGAMYLARWLAGVREPWAGFDPAPLRIDYQEIQDDGPDPTGSVTVESPTS